MGASSALDPPHHPITFIPMQRYRYTIACGVILGVLAISLGACDSVQDDPIDGTAAPNGASNFVYTYDDGSSIDIVLNASFIPERQTFATSADYDKYLEEVRASGTVTLNPEVWERVGHAFTPEEVSALDMSGAVAIEGYLFEAEREAGYKTELKGGPRELEVYYGENGDADQEEFEEIMRHALEPEALATATFRDPSAQKLYKSLTSEEKGDPYIQYLQAGDPDTGTYLVIQLPFSSPNGTYPTQSTYGHNVGMLVGNQSTGSLWYKKAKGWTQVIFRPVGTSTWYGSYYGNYGTSGVYNQFTVTAAVWGDGDSPYTLPYFSGTVMKTAKAEASVESGRDGGESARSLHWLKRRYLTGAPLSRSECDSYPFGPWYIICSDQSDYYTFTYRHYLS